MIGIDPSRSTAAPPDGQHSGGVTLINSFSVPEGREDAFMALWMETSGHFRAQPGFISLRLHRALSAQAPYRFINVAEWASARQFADAHSCDEFKRLISQPAWREFPPSPALYEVVLEASSEGGCGELRAPALCEGRELPPVPA